MVSHEIRSQVVASGQPISPGIVQGILVRDWDEALEVQKMGERPILVSRNLSMDLFKFFRVIGGIISEAGSFGAHLATNALEYGLPVVSSVQPMTALETGMEVILDANEGRILSLGWISPSPLVAEKVAPKQMPKFVDKVSAIEAEQWLRKWSVPMDARSVELVDLNGDGLVEVIVTSEKEQLFIFTVQGELVTEVKLPAKSTQSRCVFWPDLPNPLLILSCDDGYCYGLDPLAKKTVWRFHAGAPKTVRVAQLEGDELPTVLIGTGEVESHRGQVVQIDGHGRILETLSLPLPLSSRKTGWVRALDIAKQDGVMRLVAGEYSGRVFCYTKGQAWSKAWQWQPDSEVGRMNWVRCIALHQAGDGEWLTLVGYMEGGYMEGGAVACINQQGKLLWHTTLAGTVNGLQVLASTDDRARWQVLTFQYGGKVQLLDSQGKVTLDLPATPHLWGGILEPVASGGGNLWLCGQEHFTCFHITADEIKPSWVEKTPKDTQQYDVFISYAGEDRAIAEALTGAMTNLGIRVFFAPFETAELWGRDNYVFFAELAQKHSTYFMPLISGHYARKAWTTHELRSAFAKAMQQPDRYILPIRVDDTEVPGLLSTVGYVSLKEKSIEEIARLVKEIVQKT